MADEKKFGEGSDSPDKNNAHTRTGIMLVLLPVVQTALAGIPGLDLAGNVAHLRRTVRALCTLAIRMLLDAGAPPEFVAAQLGEALAHELKEREEKAQAQAAEAQAEGGAAIFTLPTKNLPN